MNAALCLLVLAEVFVFDLLSHPPVSEVLATLSDKSSSSAAMPASNIMSHVDIVQSGVNSLLFPTCSPQARCIPV